MNINKCNLCKHKSEVGVYNLQMCITCSDNPFVIDDRFDAKEIEIRPEKAGELWENEAGENFLTFGSVKYLRLFKQDGGEYDLSEIIPETPIHGKNGWTRLFPKVEDESVERIEIEGVTWEGGGLLHPTGGNCRLKLNKVVGIVGTRLIIEIPKETS